MMSSDVAASWQVSPVIGRTLLIGCAIGVAVSFAGMVTAGLVGGLGVGPSLGLGVFVSFWGGLGFGGMMGGAAGLIQDERLDTTNGEPAAVPVVD